MKESRSLMTGVSSALILLLGLGCGAVKEKKVIVAPPSYAQAKTATPQELVLLLNERYAGVKSVTVRRCEVEFTGGSIDDGYLEKYRKANGLLIAQSPDSIFVNILNPLTNSTVVVMASRNEQFQIWIPSKNTFVTGQTDVTPEQDNPIYNVRPSHIMEGILVEPIPLNDPKYRYFVVEEEDGQYRYYVLGVFQLKENSSDSDLLRRIWIERSTMRLKKQQYYDGAEVVSTINYDDAVELGGSLLNARIGIQRPRDRYAIEFRMEPENIKLDRELKPDAFEIRQPAGAEVIIVDQQDGD
jgi:outer membrane lipoprotein-sorting protein